MNRSRRQSRRIQSLTDEETGQIDTPLSELSSQSLRPEALFNKKRHSSSKTLCSPGLTDPADGPPHAESVGVDDMKMKHDQEVLEGVLGRAWAISFGLGF